MPRRPILLVAASGLALESLVLLERLNAHEVLGIVDDNPELAGSAVGATNVIGELSDIVKYPRPDVLICVGSGLARAAIVERLSGMGVAAERFATVIHPKADIPESCTVGRGSIVLSNVTATADVSIGEHVVVMPNSVITHGGVIADFATLCAGVALGGGVHVGRGAYIGMNASVRQNVIIGEGSTLGMGSALLTDLPAMQVWGGCPARRIDRPHLDTRTTPSFEAIS